MDNNQVFVLRTVVTLVKLSVLKSDASSSLLQGELDDVTHLHSAILGLYKDVVTNDAFYRARQIAYSPILSQVALLPNTPITIKNSLTEIAAAHL